MRLENLYDDTVILVYGDHNGLDMYNEELQDFKNKFIEHIKKNG